ncbi:MAG: sulfate adenylyltransferase subunit CysN [Myxococcales bacterium]|nr:sulfate adenylyltransferase subunit CysN [Myxococcales bacterium]
MAQWQSSEHELAERDIDAFLEQNQQKELLRFVAVGSVDDGKSTLIGRLLHDTKGVYEDQLADASDAAQGGIDFARITDGLKSEREQGITIDVAYRYFSTPKRKFIIADTPGHVQYTRNMATGASTANVAIILIDARLGVQKQSRRHAYIASLLGIPHLLVAVNKMDLVGFAESRFVEIRAELVAFAEHLGFRDLTFIPISALDGDNVVERSERTPWHVGGTLLEFLETVEITRDRNSRDFRYPVQLALRPNLNYRGFAGQIASGAIRRGERVLLLPSGVTTTIKAIDTYGGAIERAFSPMSVILRFEDEVDCGRGDMVVCPDNLPHVARHVEAMVVWMADKPLDTQKSYFIKHTTRYVRANIEAVEWLVDLETLEHRPAATMALNDIGRVRLTCHQPLYFDAYTDNRATGAFVIIDSLTNNTVGAGMILEPPSTVSAEGEVEPFEELTRRKTKPATEVSPTERAERLRQRGSVVWLTGLPAAGKSTIAYALERRLFDLGFLAHVLDPDDVRYSSDRGAAAPELFGDRSLAAVAARFRDTGLITICAVVSGSRASREEARTTVGADDFFEVYISTPEAVCRQRDHRGIYAGAESGRFPEVEGVHRPYEAPTEADLVLPLDRIGVDEAVERLVELLEERRALSFDR